MVRGRAILAGVLAAPWIRVAHGQVAHRISLIHFNDFHSRHEAADSKQLTCATRFYTRLDSGTRQRNQAAEPGSGTGQRGRGGYPQLSAQLGVTVMPSGVTGPCVRTIWVPAALKSLRGRRINPESVVGESCHHRYEQPYRSCSEPRGAVFDKGWR